MNYVANTEQERKQMLGAIGVRCFEELLVDIPEALRIACLDLPSPLTEPELLRHLHELSHQNTDLDHAISFLGAGAYDHFIPSVVPYLTGRGEFATAYTPYQPEVSQGTLQSVYEYQSLVCELTGMDVSNASLYDGASALAEAAVLASLLGKRREIVVGNTVHPEYRQVLRTYLHGLDVPIHEAPMADGLVDLEALKDLVGPNTAAVLAQQPNFFGNLEPMKKIGEIAHSEGALFVSSVYPISLGLLEPPGVYRADVAVGEGQPLGNAIGFGGPYLGFFATTDRLLRKVPGRVAGMTTDVDGKRGFVLTLQAREQHIRREKATSNICTNQALNALAACVYLAAIGKEGIREVAELNVQKSHYAKSRICELEGYEPLFVQPFFNEFAVRCPADPRQINERLMGNGIIGGLPLGGFYQEYEDAMLFCVTEQRTKEDIDRLVMALADSGA